jgi:hypothetical protein
MRVQEVYLGSATHPRAQFVELRFRVPVETTAGSQVFVADRNGANAVPWATFPANALLRDGDRRLLACTVEAIEDLGLICDAVASGLLDRAGGAVFFSAGPDLVFYGEYTASLQGQSSPAPLPSDGHSIDRTGYTGSSGADFVVTEPSPRSNLGLGPLLPHSH